MLARPAFVAWLCLASPAAWGQTVQRVTRPLRPAHLDLATGTYTVGRDRVSPRGLARINTAISITNLDFSGSVAVDSFQCEWFDAFEKGRKKTGGKSQVMTSFVFAYCSSARPTSSGGVGGSATISFVEGYTTPPLGTPAPPLSERTQVFNLSGLPARTGTNCGWGQCFDCYLMKVDVAAPATTPSSIPGAWVGGASLPDGPMGYAWRFQDEDPLLGAATFPFLACVQSCSGIGPDGQTMVDGLDKYCGVAGGGPPYTMVESFTFGTTSTHTSLSFEVREAQAVAAASTGYNGSGANPAGTIAAGQPPVLGAPWSVSLDCSLSSTPSKPALLRLGFGPPVATPLAPFGELHAVGGGGRTFFQGPHGSSAAFVFGPGTGSVPAIPPALPVDLGFLNACWTVQGFCGDAPNGYLTSSLVQTIGSGG